MKKDADSRYDQILHLLTHKPLPNTLFRQIMNQIIHSHQPEQLTPEAAAQRAIRELILNNDILDIEQGFRLFQELYGFRDEISGSRSEIGRNHFPAFYGPGFEAVANHARVDGLDNSGAREWVPLEYPRQNPYKNATTIIAWGTFWMRAAAMGISPLPEFFARNTIFMPPLDDILSLLLSMKSILVDNLSVNGQTRPVWSVDGGRC